jgi:hypothetical protein
MAFVPPSYNAISKKTSLALFTTYREPQGRAIGIMECWNIGLLYHLIKYIFISLKYNHSEIFKFESKTYEHEKGVIVKGISTRHKPGG